MTEPSEILETQTYEKSSRRYNSAYRIRTRTISPDLQKYKMRTLNKQIKENNVDKILGEAELNWAGQREDLVVAEDEKNEMVNNITTLRKKLDETRDLYNKKELEMARMKDEIEKMKGDEGYFNDHTYKSRWRVEQLKNALEMQKLKLEEAHISKKTYEGMLDRMRKDNLVDKVKTTKLEKSLSVKSRALSSESKSTRKAYQMRTQTTHVFGEILKRVENEDRKRQENLFLFERAVITKEIAEKGRAERIKRTENLQDLLAKEMSLTGEKQYRNLYLVHKFVHLFYKKQMDEEMKKNSKNEWAFQRIRAAVGITDAQLLVEKFIKREETYSELLTSISNQEKQLDEAKAKKEKLEARVAILREKHGKNQKQKDGRKAQDYEAQNVYKIFSDKSETYKEANFKLERSHIWAIKILQILDKARSVEEPTNYAEIFPKGMAIPAILKVIQSIKEELRFINNEDYIDILDDIERTDVNLEITKKEFLLKNTRVKEDEIMSEGRRSQSSSRSPSRITTTMWEERNSSSKSPIQVDDEFENTLNARRREIKHKQNQANLLKRIQDEKLKEEENKYR